ncbi:MAG: hypothetical protein ACK4UN_15020 [Limisphaerales bacterium]
MRFLILTIFGIQTLITAILIWDLLQRADGFPGWFAPVVVFACLVMLGFILRFGKSAFYDWDKLTHPEPRISRFIALGIVLSVLASTSLHAFYPFRTDTFERVASIPFVVVGSGPRLAFNFLFSGIGFVTSAFLAILYSAGKQKTALVGLTFLAGFLLFPNDNCRNEFNRTWNSWIGASPLMFLPASVATLVGVAGMRGIFPGWSLVFVISVTGIMLLLGLSHMYQISW